MASENEPAKLLLPYLQRADELQKHEPLVAYYCRLYAMEQGLKIPPSDRTKTTNSLLISLMKQLEKDKKSLTLGSDDHLHIEGFALNVFAKADKQDRAGRADLNTAKTFYAASIFFEILNQFGEVQPELEQKQKYAVWKAADIRKALKEGRKPVPGPPGGDNLSVPTSTSIDDYDLGLRSGELDSGPPKQSDYPPQHDLSTRHASESDSSPQAYDQANFQHPADNPHSPSSIMPPSSSSIQPSPTYPDKANFQHPANIPQLPSSITPPSSSSIQPSPTYPTDDYSSQNFHQLPPTDRHDNTYSQLYHQQSYQQEGHQHLPNHYPSHDAPSYSYPNFQSYPSFTQSSLPTAPSHYPSYPQGSVASYSTSSTPNVPNYPSSNLHNSSSQNGSVSEGTPTPAQTFHYNSNYEPPPEKIAEAHKAARFAVGALAFDDVPVAVDFLRKSLEFLTNPSAGH